jgi:hypothetical protein
MMVTYPEDWFQPVPPHPPDVHPVRRCHIWSDLDLNRQELLAALVIVESIGNYKTGGQVLTPPPMHVNTIGAAGAWERLQNNG